VGQRQSFIKLLSLPFFADTPVGEDRAQSQNVQNKETLHDRIRDKRKSAQFAARRDQQYPRYITRFRVLVHSRNGPTRAEIEHRETAVVIATIKRVIVGPSWLWTSCRETAVSEPR
jgi:hypothetical protein